MMPTPRWSLKDDERPLRHAHGTESTNPSHTCVAARLVVGNHPTSASGLASCCILTENTSTAQVRAHRRSSRFSTPLSTTSPMGLASLSRAMSGHSGRLMEQPEQNRSTRARIVADKRLGTALAAEQ